MAAGSLSAVTVFMMLAGGLARIFTTLQETPDATVLLVNYVCGATAAATLLAQVRRVTCGGVYCVFICVADIHVRQGGSRQEEGRVIMMRYVYLQ